MYMIFKTLLSVYHRGMFFDRILASKQDRNLVVAFYRWPSFLHVNILLFISTT